MQQHATAWGLPAAGFVCGQSDSIVSLTPLGMRFSAAVQEIARLGMWNLTALQLFYMLTGLKPSTLLAMGRWDPNKPFDQYWREAMDVIVPERFIHLLMPFYAPFKADIDALTAAGTPVPTCARSLAELLPFPAYVVVQEALELCGDDRPAKYRENPVHKLLLADQEFR